MRKVFIGTLPMKYLYCIFHFRKSIRAGQNNLIIVLYSVIGFVVGANYVKNVC